MRALGTFTPIRLCRLILTRSSIPLASVCFAGFALLLASVTAADAETVTLTQVQLLSAEEVTTQFGGNGQILSRVADGAGVLYTIQGGTIDFGKVSAQVRLGGADLSGYDRFGLQIDIVSAPNPVEINPFILTGSVGGLFAQDVPGVKVQGDSFASYVDLTGVSQLDDTFALGFQYFTAGDVEMPPAQTVMIRVSPVPEPGAGLLLGLGLVSMSLRRRTRSRPDAGRGVGSTAPRRLVYIPCVAAVRNSLRTTSAIQAQRPWRATATETARDAAGRAGLT